MLKQKLIGLILVSLIPQSINNYVVRHQEGLSIRVSKNSPPLAIFEDEQIKPQIIRQLSPIFAAAIPLRSGTIDLTRRALEIAQRFTIDDARSVAAVPAPPKSEKIVTAEKEVSERTIVQLSGMRIQKNNPNVRMLIKSIPVEKQPARPIDPQTIQETETATTVTENQYRPNPNKDPYQQFEDIKRHYLAKEFMADLPPAQRERLEGIKDVDKILSMDWSQPTFEQQARELLASNNNAAPAPNPPSVVRVPHEGVPQDGITVADNRNFTRDEQTDNPQLLDFSKVARTRSVEPKQEVSNPLLLEPQLLIAGSIEMADGLAYLGNEQYIKVYRQAGTQLLEEGNVVVKEGRYEILVRNPQDGVVIAELRTIDQQTLGRGEILLSEEVGKRKSREELKNIPLKIRPIAGETQAITISGYSFDEEKKIEGAKISVNGFMDIAQTDHSGKSKVRMLADSSLIVKASKEGYWGSVLFKSAGQVFKHTLFGEETVKSWFEQLNLNSSKKTGIIWGEVKIGSTSVSDVEVEVVSSQLALQPTYFVGGVIPDSSLAATTANGRFAFFDIEPGIYVVRAKYKGKYFPPQVVVVDRGYVSTVALQWQEKSPSEVYVFNIENSEPMESEIRFLGSDKTAHSKTGKHIVNFSGSEGVQILEVDPQSNNHYVSRATVDKSNKQVMVPIISYGWISHALSRGRINQNYERGVIVGIARKSDMRIELDPLGYDSETEIVYFDSHGEVLIDGTSAPQGGGFIIFNAIPGVRTILMTYKGIQQTQIHTALSDPDVINVFNPNY